MLYRGISFVQTTDLVFKCITLINQGGAKRNMATCSRDVIRLNLKHAIFEFLFFFKFHNTTCLLELLKELSRPFIN